MCSTSDAFVKNLLHEAIAKKEEPLTGSTRAAFEQVSRRPVVQSGDGYVEKVGRLFDGENGRKASRPRFRRKAHYDFVRSKLKVGIVHGKTTRETVGRSGGTSLPT